MPARIGHAPGTVNACIVFQVPNPTETDLRRRLPSVDQALQAPGVAALLERHGRAGVLRELRGLLEEARARATAGDGPGLEASLRDLPGVLAARLLAAGAPSLVPVINATGVVVHTNLGRAPLSPEAAARVAEIASSYSNLEFDLDRGDRGDREVHAEGRLSDLLGVEATLVVNNCAAAVLLAVNTFAEGKEALVSRGELVEIGGSFRIPEILGKGGARLREVGTTNRTRLADYGAALGPETGMILRVHPSNFKIVGFTESPSLKDLAGLAREAGVPLVEDQGSGLLAPLPAPLDGEPTVAQSLLAGADVVTFSGDKLLGGPQAGLAAGRRAALAAMRRNPLYRALRVDKMTLAALDAVLLDHAAGRARESVPVLRMLTATVGDLRARAEAFARALRPESPSLVVAVEDGTSAVGGGAAPAVAVPTALVTVVHPALGPARLAAALRAGRPPVVARVADDRLILDLRTVSPGDEPTLRDALVRAVAAQDQEREPS
jgi:L-seryl-tRNA(Ser) seleniumtransferase